jgi:hypothetical protein
MPRSKYPGQLDTSVEIPAVRDNVLEVGSDAINSLRSAIFQIERTLGVNPQGAVGNTVADRINKSLDGNGNILPDALDKANVLSGPITNEDVSPVAAISESKLRLNIATRVLQSQITQVAGQIDTIVSQLDELSTSFAVHINPNATNRHPATAISVAGNASTPNTVAASDLQTGNVQTALQELYDSHINFSGVATALGNASHTAQQIYFDNTNVPEFTDASDVQEAIEDVALLTSGGQQIHQDLFHSNGALRFGKITSPGESTGRVISADQEVTFGQNSGSSSGITTITFISPIDLGDETLEISDIITISDVNDEDGNISGSYEIAAITLNGSNQVASVDVFHVFRADSTASTLATLTRNINTEANESGLLAVARESATLTSSQTVQIANPNAVRIFSTGIQPTAITTSNRFFNLSIDGGSAITLDAYNGDVTRQSIDSVVTRINEQCAEQALDVMAYRLDKEDGTSELAIVHNLPDEQTEVHTLKVTAGSDGGITALGLASLDDVEVSGEFGSEYYISGVAYNGLASKLDSSLLNYFVSTNTVGNGNSNINFIEEGIKSGDLITISGASSDDDNGTYVITSVNDTQLILDSTQLPTGFADTSGENTRFRIFHNIVSFSSITFQEVSGTFGAVVADVFIDDERKPFYKTRLEYNAEISGVDSVITVVDFVGDVTGKQVQISADTGAVGAIISIDGGNAVEVAGFDKYFWLKSGTENIFLKLYIADVGALITEIGAGPAITIDVFGFQGVNQDSNMKIARVPYGNFKGRVIGGKKTSRVLSKVQKGNVGPFEISNEAKRALVYRPLDELRSNGVVRGLEILNATIDGDGFYNFDMEDGICYVGGRRFDLSGIDTFVTDIDSTAVDKLFVVIDEDGNLMVEQSISVGSDCFSPFGVGESAVLASLEYDGSVISIIDLRLFIDELDLKLLNSITVSPQRGLGHFTTVQKGLAYAKRFGQLFPSAGVPTVHLKSGTYEINVDVDSSSLTYLAWSLLLFFTPALVLPQYYDANIQQGLFINFPVNLTGEGESTVISARTNYTFSDVSYSFRGIMLIPGNGFTQTTLGIDVFDSGFMSISNLKMENCRINPVDIRVIDGADEPLSFFIDIDRVVFDLTGFPSNPLDDFLAPSGFGITEGGDQTRPKGNVAIRNCKFLEAEITGPGNDDIQNMLIMNNIYFGEEDGGLLTGNFYDFTTTADSQNVNIIGNIHANNLNPTDDPSGPNIVSGGNQRWGDRFSRDIYVGGEVNVNDNLIVENTATSGSFAYPVTKTREFIFTWFNVPEPNIGPGANATTISRIGFLGSVTWRCAVIPGSDEAYYMFTLPPGLLMDSIELGVSEQGVGGWDWTITLYEQRIQNNARTNVFSDTQASDNSSTPSQVVFPNVNITSQPDIVYQLEISHDQSFSNNSIYIKVITTFTEMEDILGV